LARKIVVLGQGASHEACCSAVQALGGKVVKWLPLVNAVVVEDLDGLGLSTLSSRADVLQVTEDIPVRAIGLVASVRPWRPVPVEGRCAVVPWGVRRVGAPWVWRRTRGEGVTVAVLDTGVAFDHPDLEARIVDHYSAVGGASEDRNGHGTHVAGIIAGSGIPNGVYGVAPRAGLAAVKVLRDDGSGQLSDVIDGLSWCVEKGVPVANLSLGTPLSHPLLKEAVSRAAKKGLLVVAAAGNSGPRENSLEYPAAYGAVVSVGACDHAGEIAPFSSRGPGLDLCAPGKDIYSTWLGGGYRRLDGTSMAAPHVAGVAALIIAAGRSVCRVLRGDGTRRYLLNGAVPLPGRSPDAQGRGMVDARKAFESMGV